MYLYVAERKDQVKDRRKEQQPEAEDLLYQ